MRQQLSCLEQECNHAYVFNTMLPPYYFLLPIDAKSWSSFEQINEYIAKMCNTGKYQNLSYTVQLLCQFFYQKP